MSCAISSFRFQLLLTIVAMAALPACKKHEGIQKESTYTFLNRTGRPVTMDLYGTRADYDQNSNRLMQHAIPPDSAVKLKLEVAREYWLDWYSQGYEYNNWEPVFSGAFPMPQLSIAAVDDSRELRSRNSDTVRSVVLSGGEVSSTWSGSVPATSGSFWAGEHEFVLHKSMKADHRFTNLAGGVSSSQYDFSINSISQISGKPSRFVLNVRNAQGAGMFSLACNLYNATPRTGRDSLRVQTLQQSIHEFVVTRK